MSGLCAHRRGEFVHIFWRGLATAALIAAILLPAEAFAQGKSKKGGSDTEKKKGKIAAVEKKGKAFTLTIEESDGEKFDVLVSGKMKFLLTGTGDAAFLKHLKSSVSSDSVVLNRGNNYMFSRTFTVHLGNNPPEPVFERNPEKGNDVYSVAGPIVDYDDETFTISVGDQTYKIAPEQGAPVEISVESTDPEHAAVGSEAVVEGTTRGGKFIATSVVVTAEKPLVADEVFAHEKKSAKTKPGASKTAAKKPAKNDKGDKGDKGTDDAASGEPAKGSSDPFGVLDGNKKDTKKKTAGGKPKEKKPAETDSDN
jgi:hypothetical protein